ncbi:hypothetical protein [Alkaliphilus serpentinus]|uniref:Uncharacterized protein n=1 Tax=Alkaliphilus serpentinus TaxID=1482731 RepID=A0A833HRN0_9FIRM|nr:hypothetical protein [Alkaliphilus serpentinus]KAB3533436.1 hypothetical protein F8153_00540 [Alkaliphilus serpentinus]
MKIDKNKLYILALAILSVNITWYLNHGMGYGAIIANGLVGVLVAILLPGHLAAAAYTASFVGMSSIAVLPSIAVATGAGIIVGILLVITAEVYAGIGGKGGTTAALATIIAKNLLSFLG